MPPSAPITRTEAVLGALRVAVQAHRAWLDATPLHSLMVVVIMNEHTGYPIRALVKPESRHEITRAEVDAALRGGRP